MDKEAFDFMEVKAAEAGWYYVTLYQFKKESDDDPDYIRDWLEFTGGAWDYAGYSGTCYVCFIHKSEAMESKA